MSLGVTGSLPSPAWCRPSPGPLLPGFSVRWGPPRYSQPFHAVLAAPDFAQSQIPGTGRVPARGPQRFLNERQAGGGDGGRSWDAGVRGEGGERASGEDRSACWGKIIGVSSSANRACPENGSRVERNRLIAPPPLPRAHSRAEARRVGAAARSAHRNSTLPLRPLPRCPPLLLYQCRKCSTDLHIFPNIRDLFFSPLCGRRQARIQEKRSWSGARGNKEPFTTAPANARQKRCT